MTRDELFKHFIYSRDYGVLLWDTKDLRKAKFNGRVAGSMRKDGYLAIKLNRKDYLAHHLIWLAETGDLPTGRIKHKDGKRSNNLFSNLFQVKANKGYCWHKGAQAYIVYKRSEGKRVHLGYARSPYLAERILMETIKCQLISIQR
jgi:hypothetical protein